MRRVRVVPAVLAMVLLVMPGVGSETVANAGGSPGACTSQWLVSSGGSGPFQPLWVDPLGAPIGELVTTAAAPDPKPEGDQWFNISGSKATDVLDAYRRPDGKTGWRVAADGTQAWDDTNFSTVAAKDLRFGDFDGDNLTDTFVALPQGTGWHSWMMSSATRATFVNLATTRHSIDRVRLGDFDGNETTDVFVPVRSGTTWAWKVWLGGKAPPVTINRRSTDPSMLRFADLDADSMTDVLTWREAGPGRYAWLVSWNGRTTWKVLTTQPRPLSAVRFMADFTGDGVLDLFYTTKRTTGYQWWMLRLDGPTGTWVPKKLSWSTIKPANLRIGRLDLVAGVDIFVSVRTCT